MKNTAKNFAFKYRNRKNIFGLYIIKLKVAPSRSSSNSSGERANFELHLEETSKLKNATALSHAV